MFIEVIANSLEDIIEINKSNIPDQIEYCIDLDKGGLTPKMEDIIQASNISRIPIRVMVRTNEGYYISDEEFNMMKDAIKEIKKTKIFGIVIGWVDKNHKLEIPKLEEIVHLAFPLKCTFHRAFDQVDADYKTTLNQLYKIGFDTILTTGNKNGNAQDNISNLINYQNHTDIRILCGKGIDHNGVKLLLKNKLTNIHLGTTIRKNNSWSKQIDLAKLSDIIK